MNPDRRDPVRRAAFVAAIVSDIVQSPMTQFTVETVQDVLEVSSDIADRVLHRLSDAGLVQETRGGVWVRMIPPPRPIPGMR
jgi:hypothetical protein